MPFDGQTFVDPIFAFKPSEAPLPDAIRLLKRARERCASGYCWANLHRRSFFSGAPKFCMHGALVLDDDGQRRYHGFRAYEAQRLAEAIVREAIGGGRSLISYGTWPLAKWRVVKAYDHAIALAESRARSL